MKTILDQILDTKREEVRVLRSKKSYKDFEQGEFFLAPKRSIRKQLKASTFGIIAEIKRKSPSAGQLAADTDITSLAKSYEQGGAIAISCLTDYTYFGGSVEDLSALRNNCSLPILRKDFIIDELQVFEAKAQGADAILLIAEALEPELVLHLTIVAQQLGLEVLLEFHSQRFMSRINEFVDIIGVNNRDLHLQTTDVENSLRLAPFLPTDRPCISESGIRSHSEIIDLAAHGYSGALIGESILRGSNPAQTIRQLQLNSHAF